MAGPQRPPNVLRKSQSGGRLPPGPARVQPPEPPSPNVLRRWPDGTRRPPGPAGAYDESGFAEHPRRPKHPAAQYISDNWKELSKDPKKPATIVAIAGAAIVTAVVSKYLGADVHDVYAIKNLPEAMKVFDDGNALRKLMHAKVPPNPLYFWDGTLRKPDDTYSPVTQAYLKTRRLKKMGGAAVSMIGIGTSPLVLGFNPAGGAKEFNALGSTIAHFVQVGRIGVSHRDDETVVGWIKQIEALKGAKGAIRGGKLTGALVPAGSAWAAVGAEVAKLGVDFLKDTLCKAVAAELHYAAQYSSRRTHVAATKILEELFERRGATRIFGRYDVDAIIGEPGGWLAVSDKIGLI